MIVGAGSAGCTLAYRLGEERDARILVIEAGAWSRDPWIRLPLGWGRILQNRLHDWMYFAEPEPGVDGRRVECARGKVVGGSSSINAMAYVRGHRSDYDRWAAGGLKGWSYAHALPYFKRQESWEHGENAYRGASGPLVTRKSRYADPLVDAYIEAGVAAGHPRTDDYNGAQQEGFDRLQSTIRNGQRWSGADAYLRPAVRRGNVKVVTGALAAEVLLNGNKASGVGYLRGGKKVVAHAEREVILAGGVINSPQLLMLSGIGDPHELAALGIPVRVALKGVGKNLQDHLAAALAYSRKTPGPFVRAMRIDRLALELARGYCLGSGFATDLPSGVVAFLKTEPGLAAPDLQVLFHAGPLGAGPWLAPFKAPFADGFSARAVLLRPESRGWLKLASPDPTTPPRIHQNFLATDQDRRVLRNGLKLLREIGKQRPLAPFIGKELTPARSDAELDAHVRATAITAHHPLGTCKMGLERDPMAVVDENCRVFGVERLRVVDASVMPDLIGGNINATVVMMAEKVSDLIKQKAPLAPIEV